MELTHAPIAVFAYNRPRHLAQVLEGLRRNREAVASDLFVYSDAAKMSAAASDVEEVRRVARGASGFRSVNIVEREKNFGLARSIIAGVSELTGRFGSVIVLEDDLLPSPDFLRYLNDALNAYRDDARVVITATNRFVTAPIARELGIENLIATEPEEVSGEFTGRVKGVPSFREGKVERLKSWMAEHGIEWEKLGETWFYSDSLNDLPLLSLVSHPVAVDPDETLKEHALRNDWRVISLR